MEDTLGKRIVTHRKRLGMTQDQLAERLGVTAQAVSKWENDQSCPDITMLPKLAEVFSVTTDALLGLEREEAHTAELVTQAEAAGEPAQTYAHNWEFKLDNSRKGRIGMAAWVLLVGGLLLASELMQRDVRFWDLLWPSGLLVFGLFGVLPKPSIFRIGCLAFGAYFLLSNFIYFPFGKGIVLPAFLVLFGISLLVDALRRPGKARLFRSGKDVQKSSFEADGETFRCATSFGENVRHIQLPRLSSGAAEVSFGELTVDITGCAEIADGCRIELNCSFGELTLRVPGSCRVEPATSTAFASVDVRGAADADAAATVYVDCDASFGEIVIRYI